MTAILSPLPLPLAPGPQAHPETPSPAWNVLPFPAIRPFVPEPGASAQPLPPLPGTHPAAPATADFPATWPSPLAVLPLPSSNPANLADSNSSAPPAASPTPAIPANIPTGPVPAAEPPPPSTPSPSAQDFSDADLSEALGPIVEQAIRRSVYAREHGIDTYLEPMLRATIRRALAEYAPADRPFKGPGALDRLLWHLKALFTSRTYEDILFEKTRRFQVEEVFLLDLDTLALVSFASCDPARHSSARRVSSTAQRIASQVRKETGELQRQLELDDHRWLVTREGRHVILVALVRGRPGELLVADLDFALRRIEDHFEEQFADPGSPLLLALQPFLEDCLLIQAPASAA